jgi:L-fucose isomerase-like protein
MWTGIAEFYAHNARPVIVADELYSGSGGFLRVHALIKQEVLPVLGIASSNFQDVIDAVRLFDVIKRMREARVLVVADGETWGTRQGTIDGALAIFGTQAVRIGPDDLLAYYSNVDPDEAEHWKDKWVQEALRVVEPDEAEIRRSARMYLALKAAMQNARADAVTIDCLGLYYADRLSAYPCLGLFQLNNEGSTGVCEADVDSTLTQLLIRYTTTRPGYVSDPVIDTAANQIIYAHCVATNRPFGPNGLSNRYIIRSHAEDHKGASVQSLLPLGYQITTAKVSVANKAFSVHTARTAANVDDEMACRTKLAAEVDAQRILDNYHSELFGWHRVTCYGNYRKQLMNLATLYGLRILEEDR